MAGGNKRQVADFFFLLYAKLKEVSFFCVVMVTPGST